MNVKAYYQQVFLAGLALSLDVYAGELQSHLAENWLILGFLPSNDSFSWMYTTNNFTVPERLIFISF